MAAAERSMADEAAAALDADAGRAFAVSMHACLSAGPGNLFYSPFSLRVALAILGAGARGETAAEIRSALRTSLVDDALHAQLAAALRWLRVAAGPAIELLMANSLWSQPDAPLLACFVGLTTQCYEAALEKADFRADAGGVRRTINAWVSARTKGRLPEVLKSSPSPDTRLALVNAIYFKAAWQDPFERAHTRKAPFYRDDGASFPAPFMRQVTRVAYLKAPDYQAVMLPYRSRSFGMWVLLPERRDGLQSLEAALTAATFAELSRLSQATRVDVSVPRFRITWDGDLMPCLGALGIRRALGPEADFSAINGHVPPDQRALYVSSVAHGAFCEVNEEGTEAAAATVSEMCFGLADSPAEPPVVFRADHPFLFAIVDSGSGAILFLGRVVDPASDN